MIDELRVEVAVDGVWVAPGEQVLDECLDQLLVLGCHRLIVEPAWPPDHPNKLGFFARLVPADTAAVPRKPSTVTAMHDLVRQCHNGLDADGLHRQLLGSLRRLLPVDAAFFATADPETLLFTGAFAEEPLAAVPRGVRRQVSAARESNAQPADGHTTRGSRRSRPKPLSYKVIRYAPRLATSWKPHPPMTLRCGTLLTRPMRGDGAHTLAAGGARILICSHVSAATQCSPITTTMTVTTAMRPPVLVKMTLVAAPGFAGGPGNLGQWLDEVFGIEWAKLGQIDDRRAK